MSDKAQGTDDRILSIFVRDRQLYNTLISGIHKVYFEKYGENLTIGDVILKSCAFYEAFLKAEHNDWFRKTIDEKVSRIFQ